MTFADTIESSDSIPLTLRCWQSGQPNLMLTHRTADILCDWTECEGHCQITVRMNGSGVSVEAHTEAPPPDWDPPHKELLGTEWARICHERICHEKTGDDLIGDHLAEMKQSRRDASLPIDLRYAGGRWEPLTFREALECLLLLREEGWIFPESVLETLAEYIAEETLACPLSSEYLTSAYAVGCAYETIGQAMGRQHQAMLENGHSRASHPSSYASSAALT